MTESGVPIRLWLPLLACSVLGVLALAPTCAVADEGGTSVWLPGSFGSLAAVPQTPGWSLGSIYYHTSLWAGPKVAEARLVTTGEVNPRLTVSFSATLGASAELALLVPTYVFATPVLGGQAAVSVTGIVGSSDAAVMGTLNAVSGTASVTRSANVSDWVFGSGDLYPQGSLRWNFGAHNAMTYVQADAPVGAYQSTRLSNLGVGHWAIDGGGGYTYFDPTSGHELSAVLGFTYNFKNNTTNYQNGTDVHLDWGASQFLNEHLHLGAVGYVYNQITSDNGSGDDVGSFKSRVAGVGPQVGYIFSLGGHQAYVNLKGYGEFDAMNRPSGWNMWLTFSIQL